MQCQKCKKKEAKIHLTEIVNGQKIEKHLCPECAEEEGITIESTNKEAINQLLTKFVLAQNQVNAISKISCPNCGTTFLQFHNTGLLGCPNDYIAFGEHLEKIIQRAQDGNLQHIGKVPGSKENKHKRQHQILRLKRELEKAVAAEDYERAAKIRDKIRSMEGQNL